MLSIPAEFLQPVGGGDLGELGLGRLGGEPGEKARQGRILLGDRALRAEPEFLRGGQAIGRVERRQRAMAAARQSVQRAAGAQRNRIGFRPARPIE